MSGNSKQRKQARDMKELVEFGRQQKESIEAQAARLAGKDGEIAELRARLAEAQADARRRAEAVVERDDAILEMGERLKRFEEDSTSEVARLQTNLDRKSAQCAEAEREAQALRERLQVAEERLADYAREGAVTRKEQQAAVREETRKLRERLRRKSEEQLTALVRFGERNRILNNEVFAKIMAEAKAQAEREEPTQAEEVA